MPMPTFRLVPLAVAVALPLLLAGCDAAGLKLPGFGDRSPDAAAQGHSGPPTVSPLEAPIETGQSATPVGTANRETVGVAAFAAQGADWSAVVDGKAAALTRQGAKPVRIPVRRIDFGAGVEFVGVLGSQAFALTVRAADCEGGAPMTASVRHSGRTSAGCAAPATAEQVATIAAAAPAPVARRPAAPTPAAPKPAAAAPAAAAPAATPATPASEPAATAGETPAATTTPAGPTPTTPPPAATPATTEPAPSTPEEPATEAPAQEEAPTTAEPAQPVVVPGGPTTLPATPVLPPLPPSPDQ